jgi:isopenicillin-N N-acyltransferase-like protein
MRGIADGSGKDLLDIVAINVRTEINFGLFNDGCTALSWRTEKRAWLAQNWDVRSLFLTSEKSPSKTKD